MTGHIQPVTVRGVLYATKTDACEDFGVKPYQVSYVCKEKGLTFEEAVEYVVSGESEHAVEVFGRKFKSISSVCRHYKLTRGRVGNLLAEGRSLEEALRILVPNAEAKVNEN